MRIGLGTVQFGSDYGVANTSGKVEFKDAESILRYASEIGIDTIDTAIDYGSSEKVLGLIGVSSFKVISKLPDTSSVPERGLAEFLSSKIVDSLQKLDIPKLYAVLLHRPAELIEAKGETIWDELVKAKGEGLVSKIGYSIYSPFELDVLFEDYPPDIVQCPFNIVDRRLVNSGWIERLSASRIEVHARSVFLQGLLLMTKRSRPSQFEKWSDLWAVWHNWLRAEDINALQACLSFVLSDKRIDRAIVGVDSLSQIEQIVSADNGSIFDPPLELSSEDERLLNPSNWSEQ